jgi:hypothetical protein
VQDIEVADGKLASSFMHELQSHVLISLSVGEVHALAQENDVASGLIAYVDGYICVAFTMIELLGASFCFGIKVCK